MNCPSCHSELVRQDHRHNGFIRVDHCEKCQGYWLDHAELETMEAGIWSDIEQLGVTLADTLSEMECPQCHMSMNAVSPEDHPGLRFDRCPGCHSLWLDSGELSQLQAVLDDFAHEHGEALTERPEGWSRFQWAAYRLLALGERSGPPPGGSGWV